MEVDVWQSRQGLPMVAPRFRLRFLNELFSPRRRHTAGASALGAHHAPGRQPARNIAFALTGRAFSECHLSHRLV